MWLYCCTECVCELGITVPYCLELQEEQDRMPHTLYAKNIVLSCMCLYFEPWKAACYPDCSHNPPHSGKYISWTAERSCTDDRTCISWWQCISVWLMYNEHSNIQYRLQQMFEWLVNDFVQAFVVYSEIIKGVWGRRTFVTHWRSGTRHDITELLLTFELLNKQ